MKETPDHLEFVAGCNPRTARPVDAEVEKIARWQPAGGLRVECTPFENEANYGGGGGGTSQSQPTFLGCIFTDNTATGAGGGLTGGGGLQCLGGMGSSILCCDIYGNTGGDWTGCIAGELGTFGNISEDPLFCDVPGGDLTIADNSPCKPGQPGDCSAIGAFDVGCPPSPVEQVTWGAIKTAFDRRGGARRE